MIRALAGLLLATALLAAAPVRADDACPTWPPVTLELSDGTELVGELVGEVEGTFHLLLPDGTLRHVPFGEVTRVLRETAGEEPPALPAAVEPPEPSGPPYARNLPPPTSPTELRPPAPAPPRTWVETTAAVPAPPYPGPPDPEVPEPEFQLPLAPAHPTFALELSVLAAVGARVTVPAGQPLLTSLGVRAGIAASPIAYQTTTELQRFHSLEGSWTGAYLLGALDLPLRITSLELSAGPALLPQPQMHLGYSVGAALHTRHREHWASHVGVLWLTDACGRDPFLVLDIGPEWSW